MDLKTYFEKSKGLGILSTANKDGKVDAAVYARPHFFEDGTIGFIMQDKLTHANLLGNPYAAYLFKENNDQYTGKRLYLKKVKESDDQELIASLSRKELKKNAECCACSEKKKKFLVYFTIEKNLPLVGS